jgi:hypothetical protein
MEWRRDNRSLKSFPFKDFNILRTLAKMAAKEMTTGEIGVEVDAAGEVPKAAA